MPILQCLCGERLDGADDDALFALLRAHADARHADFPLSDSRIRDLLAARARMTPWNGQREPLAGPVSVRALAPGDHDEYLRFFDRDAFMDNPMWASCYCLFHEFAGSVEEWTRSSGAENRAAKSALLRAGRSEGYLATAGGRTVGWCHAAPRTMLPMLRHDPEIAVDDAERVGSIACFVVAAPFRGQGVAKRLLDAACDGLRARGLAIAEGYPRTRVGSDADAYHGPLELYQGAGFEIFREGKRVIVVRKAL
jgi:ribosomal protein S18 acetylase RimI-like enzyme